MLKDLLEARQSLWAQGKALIERAEGEKRAMNAEEERQFNELMAECDRLDNQRKAVESAEERAKDAAEAMERMNVVPEPEKQRAQESNEQLRSFLNGEGPKVLDTWDGSSANFRDLVKGTATAGGNVVPTSFRDQLLVHMIESSAILQAGPTVLNTASGETIDVPITTSFSTAALTAEAAAIGESDPAFGKRQLGAYKYGVIVQISRELVSDSGVDLTGFVSMQAGRACGLALGADLVAGNGSSKPAGIVTGATVGVTGANSASGAFTADNLIDLYYSVIAPYRNRSTTAWMMRDATLASLRKLKDTTNQYLWQPSMQVGAPDTLLGKPVYTDPNFAAVGASAKSVLFGDISAYFVRLAGAVRLERSDDFAFNTDLVTFKAVVRGDGILADQTGAVKVFQGGT